MEVSSKVLKPWANEVTLTLIDTAFALNGRYGTFGPTSIIGSGSDTQSIQVIPSFGTTLTSKNETWKWAGFIGEYVAIHSPDWTFYEEKRILTLQAGVINLDAPLSSAPPAGYFVDQPRYPTTTDPNDHAKWKRLHTYFTPTVTIVGSSARDRFDVSSIDASKFLPGLPVYIHDDNYTNKSSDLIVSSITGTTVFLRLKAGFDIVAGMKIELIGFKDGGLPYRYV
jgi:hypothetical protein